MMLKYAFVATLSFCLGALLMHSCKPDKVEKLVINKTITDALHQQIDSMQKAKKEVKLKPLASIQIQVDTFKTIDTSAKELIKDLVVQIAKRDTIINLDSMQIKALVDISNIQMKQIDTLTTKLDEATEINETLVTQINKPKKTLKYSLIANFVLLIGCLVR